MRSETTRKCTPLSREHCEPDTRDEERPVGLQPKAAHEERDAWAPFLPLCQRERRLQIAKAFDGTAVDIAKLPATRSRGLNLGLLMRQLIGVSTPRGLQGRLGESWPRFLRRSRRSARLPRVMGGP